MNNELFFNLLLPHLSLDVVYRLYPFSSDLRRMVDNRFYWLKLIERDLKMVPQFEFDPKLHYLRLMNYPIGGSLKISKTILIGNPTYNLYRSDKVLQYLHGVILYRNNNIGYNGNLISLPESIKFVRKVLNDYYAIAYSGKVYDLGNYDPTEPVDTSRIDVLDMSTISDVYDIISMITHKGELILLRKRPGDRNLFVRTIDLSKNLDSKAIQLRGNYVMTEKGTIYILGSHYRNFISSINPSPCRALLPHPSIVRGSIIVDTVMSTGTIDDPLIFNPSTGDLHTKKRKSTIFIDPIGGDLLGQGLDLYYGDMSILEVCDTRSSELIFRTL